MIACDITIRTSTLCLEQCGHLWPQLMASALKLIQIGELPLGYYQGEGFFFNLGSEMLLLSRCLPQTCCISLFNSNAYYTLMFSVSSGLSHSRVFIFSRYIFRRRIGGSFGSSGLPWSSDGKESAGDLG